MTDDEIDAMPASRETDAMVAEVVFGWQWRAFIPAYQTEDEFTDGNRLYIFGRPLGTE